jgi:peptide/nickel transport system permease protein
MHRTANNGSQVAATDDISHDTELQALAERPGFVRSFFSLVRRQPVGAVGGFIILAMFFMAIFAPWLTSHDHLAINFDKMLTPPGSEFVLGSDQFGRDILTRLIYGSRTALFVGFICAFIGATTGLVLGVTSAYIGGTFDLVFQRIMDVFQAFPLIIMALAIVAIFGTTLVNVMIAITIPLIPDCARVVRSSALAIRSVPYVDAARANGFSGTRIVLRHIAPNVMAPFLIMFTTFVGQAILLEASLSFLGLGVQEPTPAWGLMLQGGAEEYAESAPWMAIWPGIAISLAVFGINLFGDALRDVLDPRLRTQ